MSDDRLEELFQELVELSPESRRQRLEWVRSGEPDLFEELKVSFRPSRARRGL